MSEEENILVSVTARQIIDCILDSAETRKMSFEEQIKLIHLFTKDILEGKISTATTAMTDSSTTILYSKEEIFDAIDRYS